MCGCSETPRCGGTRELCDCPCHQTWTALALEEMQRIWDSFDPDAPVRGVIEDAPVPDDHVTRAEENAMQDRYDRDVEGWAS